MGGWSEKKQMRRVRVASGTVCRKLIKGCLANREHMVARQPLQNVQ